MSNTKRAFGRLVLGMISSVIVGGCGTVHVAMKVQHPAEINMTKYKQIAITEIQGNYGNEFHDILKGQLIESGRFTLVDRQNLAKMMTELQLSNSDLAQSDKAAELGKLMPAAAIINGRLSGEKNENLTYEDLVCYRDRRDKQGYLCGKRYHRNGIFLTSGSLDVIDVGSGVIVKSKSFGNRCEGRTSADNARPMEIDYHALANQCMWQNVTKFMKAISPWTEIVQVPFKTDGDIPMLEAGVNQAKIGNLKEAEDMFREAAKSAEMNPKISPADLAKAYWNLGLLYTYSDQHDKALVAFNKSYSLDPSSDCANQISNCKKLQMEKRKLDEQNQKIQQETYNAPAEGNMVTMAENKVQPEEGSSTTDDVVGQLVDSAFEGFKSLFK